MITLVLRRLGHTVLLLVAVLSLTFGLLELVPGDGVSIDPNLPPEAVKTLRHQFSDARPTWSRFVDHVGGALTGDFGLSLRRGVPVRGLIAEALWPTLLLSSVSIGSALLAGLCFGALQARSRLLDRIVGTALVALACVPTLFLGLAMQVVFALWLGVLPASGMHDAVAYDGMHAWGKVLDVGKHLVLPGVLLGVSGAALEARLVRDAIREALASDYVRAARARGLGAVAVAVMALRQVVVPLAGVLGLALPALFSGSVVTEIVFGWPGMGRLILTAVNQQDTTVLLGCFWAYTLLVAVGGLVTDLLVAWADPRVRL